MKQIFKHIFIITFLLLMAIKCKKPDPISSLPEPNPASAEITLDAASSTTKTIGPEGGKIEIAGKDGLEYLFNIPKGFLIAETQITMTPITSLTSPMLEKFTAGVHLEPNGLIFPGVAWLEILGGAREDKLVGITYEGNGDEVALSWAEINNSTIRIPITHFSGAGAGTPAPGAGDRSPNAPYKAMSNLIAEAYIENDYNCIGQSHPIGKYAIAWYKGLLTTFILPKLEEAAKNDLVLADAIRNYIEWIAWPDYVVGMLCFDINEEIDGKMETKAEEFIKTGLKNAMDTATDYCAKSHDISETEHMIDWVAVSMFLTALNLDVELDTNDMIERIMDCLTFELQFSSIIETKEGNDSGFSGTLNSTIESIIPEATGEYWGWISEKNAMQPWYGPLDYTPNLKYPSKPGCKVIISRVKTEPASALLPGVIIPKPTRIVDKYRNIPDQEGTEQDDAGDKKKKDEVMLIFYPLKGTEFIEVTCSDLWGGTNPDGTFGTASFNWLHEDTMNPKYNGFSIMMEKQGPGKLYARKKFERTRYEDGVMITERTSFELFHKPKGRQ
ncbi:MAG TPA: hypothetical protein VIS27_13875 [Yeosuana sp.]